MINSVTYKIQAFIIFGFLFFLSINLYAQVGIGDLGPNESSLLDINHSKGDKGILIPRVSINNLGSKLPITSTTIEIGLLVYNTNEATGKGFYYWNGSEWVDIDGGNDWKLTGNFGTIPGTNFIGTTDGKSYEVISNGTSRMRFYDNGQITIGFGSKIANSNEQVGVNSTFQNGTALGAFSEGPKSGLFGNNTVGIGFGILGINIPEGNGVYGFTEGGITAIKGENGGGDYSVWGINGPIYSGTSYNDAFIGKTKGNGVVALWALNFDDAGVGLLGVNNNLSVIPEVQRGAGVIGAGANLGVYGYAGRGDTGNARSGNEGGRFSLDMDNDPQTPGYLASANLAGYRRYSIWFSNYNDYFGGYFSGGKASLLDNHSTYAYVGLKEGTNANGSGGTNYKIKGIGTPSTLINDDQGNTRIMFTPEAPEILFQDFGVGKLVNGQARIDIDLILKNSLYVDDDHPLMVFVSFEGECNGLYVSDKSIDGFTVKEFQNGRSNVSFTWQIVANRADAKELNGDIASKHVGLRLPYESGPLETPKAKLLQAKKNIGEEKPDKLGNTLSDEELINILESALIREKSVRLEDKE